MKGEEEEQNDQKGRQEGKGHEAYARRQVGEKKDYNQKEEDENGK